MKKFLIVASLLGIIGVASEFPALADELPAAVGAIPQVSVEGIGQFKIGMKHEDFLKSFPPTQGTITPTSTFTAKSAGVYNYVGTVDYGYASGNFDPLAKAYFIKSYTVAGITADVEVLFYKGLLIHVKGRGLDLQKAFESKYGKGNVQKKKKLKNCSDANNLVRQVEEFDMVTRWKNKNILATAVFQHWNITRCEMDYLIYTIVENQPVYKEYGTRNHSFQKGKEESLRKQQAGSLKDL